MIERTESSSVTITSEGAFLILADESASVNRPEFWSLAMNPSQRAAATSELTGRGALFMWTMVLDGTFRIAFRARLSAPDQGSPMGHAEAFVLKLPSGVLVVRSSTSTVRAMSVRPGTYAGTLLWDLGQESDHSAIESAENYPEGEGPDGIVDFWPVG